MEFHRSNRFLSTLSDSIKLVAKNGKLVSLVAFLSVFLSSICLLLLAYFVQSPIRDMVVATHVFHSSGLRRFNKAVIARLFLHLRTDGAIIFALEVVFILALSTISFFSTISTILISTVPYNAKSLSTRELFSLIKRSWMRPLVTRLYVSGLLIAYFLVVFMFFAPIWIYPGLPTFWLGVVILIPSYILYSYLLVPWILSVVVAVAEESVYGLEALGRAAVLVKGKRMHGFLLNVMYGAVMSIVFLFYSIKIEGKEVAIMRLMLMLCVSYLVKILLFVAYTVLYFQCKIHHGEEMELHAAATVEYTKLSIDL